MLSRLRPRSIYDVMAAIGCFAALATGTAYAANTIRSSDIVDGEIGSADVKDNSLNTFDVHSFIGEDVIDGTLTGNDVADTSSLGPSDIREESLLFNNTLIASDIAAGAVGSDEAADNSLTGADINESTLDLSPVSTTTFVGATGVVLPNSFVRVAYKDLPEGSWAITATANTATFGLNTDHTSDAVCELRNGSSFIGGTTDRRKSEGSDPIKRSLTMNGGAQIPPGGGRVSLWCLSQLLNNERVDFAQIMMTRVGGFS